MREILFRAKRTDNGEWIVGCLLVDYITGQYFLHALGNSVNESSKIGEEGYLRFVAFEIDPSTLCQYTGMKDKNGNRIWENDIVRCNRREKEAKYKVVWDKTYVDFRIEKLNGLGIMPICIEEGNTPVFGRHYECIGNIFDNPELLKGE